MRLVRPGVDEHQPTQDLRIRVLIAMIAQQRTQHRRRREEPLKRELLEQVPRFLESPALGEEVYHGEVGWEGMVVVGKRLRPLEEIPGEGGVGGQLKQDLVHIGGGEAIADMGDPQGTPIPL